MLFWRALFLVILATPALAQKKVEPVGPLDPFAPTANHARRYAECMQQARREPLKALPLAEKWKAEGGGLGARHCVAIAMFESGQYVPAAMQLEQIERDMGTERPGLRAELLAQAGQAWNQANQAENAAKVQSRALGLKPQDADLWIDRGLSYAAMRAWPRAISDFDQALTIEPYKVEIYVLRAAAWRNAGNPARAQADADRALTIAPDNPEILLERALALQAQGNHKAASVDLNKVLKVAKAGSDTAKRAEAALNGERSSTTAPPPAASKR
ncbi:MAG: tetratricopeptide repeat protein [Reyranella sp.]|uniref:tetratricopeptide repeat protein n=1 Tax=Reyranella sp. TaxID=1929291 RepID=UPI001AC7C00A|nr:tetratricopeptide repeat protein [Reyranella sp.]MBN9086602.1 tetratricopeptide repeat protein [Reyranella sp.]